MHHTDDVTTWTMPQALAKQAKKNPDNIAIRFVDGPQFSYQQILSQANKVASSLASIGFKADDKLALFLPNCPEFIHLWLGCHQADGVMVGLNTELVGDFLLHALTLSEASVLVCQKAQLNTVLAISTQLKYLKTIIITDSDTTFDSLTKDQKVSVISYQTLLSLGNSKMEPVAKFSDLACLMFTSGTTGPSKAVMMPHAHCYLFGLGTIDNLGLEASDTYYITMPLFHVNALFMQVYACLIKGATAVIRNKFSASNWISDIEKYGVTHTNLLGVMTEFVARQPDSTHDKRHKLKVISAAPAAPALIDKFATRFNVPLVELYGMSEVNIPLFTPIGKHRPGSCGLVYSKYFEVRVADPETDLLVAPEIVGEIQVRPKIASGFMSGYYRMPEKTLEACKNLWFHTGDAGKYDKDGYFYFVDRIKDCLRRRGENISSYEVELALQSLEGVEEVAVIGVPSDIPGGEQEVMAIIAKRPELSAELVHAHCMQVIPQFAVPRYIRFIEAEHIPRTATDKIRKVVLREQGVTADTWDASLNQ